MSVSDIWIPFWLTIRLSLVTTVLLLVVCIPFSWWLATSRSFCRPIADAIATLPLVLPPSVLGFYLLICLSPHGPIGGLSQLLGGPELVFSFPGLVLGSMVYSLPFVAQPLRNAFASLSQDQLEAASTLGAKPLDRFFSIALPQARRGILSAAVLGFAHTLGEFGVVLMIGGSIPGQTRTMSIAIYENVEMLNYGQAHLLAAIMLVSSFLLLIAIYALDKRSRPIAP